jgi:acetyl esterase
MTAPLDPVIAGIIPLLPLRDPATMTPQSCRDALRALAAARAAIPPPPVASADDGRVKGAFEDGFAAVQDVITRIAEFGGDDRRVGVAGDSAGGNLATAVAIACRDAGIRLTAQLLAYPVTDVFGNYADAHENARFPSRAQNAEGYFLSRAVMEWFAGHYLEDARHGTDWRVSPLRAKSLAGLAPAVVCTAWFDPLRDEGKAYADALAAAGVATKYHRGEGLIHGYFGLGEVSQTAKAEAQRARADFKAMLERDAGP